MKSRSYGFTLIEILIAVVIIGILAGIAVPQYGAYVRDARRTDAHIALRSAAQELERCRSQTFAYNHALCDDADVNSPEGDYTIATTVRDANAFTLTATPSTTGRQKNDTKCATMALDNAGATTAADSAGNDMADECW